MATKLDKAIKRELELDDKLYTVTIAPDGIKVVPKGGRKGVEMDWRTIVNSGGEGETRRESSSSFQNYGG